MRKIAKVDILDGMTSCQAVIDIWKAHLAAYPNVLPINEAKVKLVVEGAGGGAWCITRNDIAPSTELSSADVELKMSVQTFLNLTKGEENPQVAYLRGEFKIIGEELLLLPFYKLFNISLNL